MGCMRFQKTRCTLVSPSTETVYGQGWCYFWNNGKPFLFFVTPISTFKKRTVADRIQVALSNEGYCESRRRSPGFINDLPRWFLMQRRLFPGSTCILTPKLLVLAPIQKFIHTNISSSSYILHILPGLSFYFFFHPLINVDASLNYQPWTPPCFLCCLPNTHPNLLASYLTILSDCYNLTYQHFDQSMRTCWHGSTL